MTNYKEVERQESLGNFWRAKEILQGRLAGCKYDCELYERYGNVLLKMHDDLEAGKFLFLCGRREPRYEKSINLYLDRFGEKQTGGLFETFPHSAQNSSIERFPEEVLVMLEKSGHDRSLIGKNAKPRPEQKLRSPFAKKCDFGCWFYYLL